MAQVKYKEGFVSIDSRLAQNKLGAIYIETLFYDHQQHTYNQVIKVYKYTDTSTGWGEQIFEGTLSELITLVEKANLLEAFHKAHSFRMMEVIK